MMTVLRGVAKAGVNLAGTVTADVCYYDDVCLLQCWYCRLNVVSWRAGIFCRRAPRWCTHWMRCVCWACECSSTVWRTKPTSFLRRSAACSL